MLFSQYFLWFCEFWFCHLINRRHEAHNFSRTKEHSLGSGSRAGWNWGNLAKLNRNSPIFSASCGGDDDDYDLKKKKKRGCWKGRAIDPDKLWMTSVCVWESHVHIHSLLESQRGFNTISNDECFSCCFETIADEVFHLLRSPSSFSRYASIQAHIQKRPEKTTRVINNYTNYTILSA